MSGNAIDILGGHEDAIHFNPAQHVLSNADYANSIDQLVEVMRAQHKEGSDFAKIYETGPDRMIDGESAHALPIHRGATGRRCRGGPPPRYRGCGPRHGRARHPLRRAGGRGFHRPRHPVERRDHAPDARKANPRRAHLRHLRVLCRARRSPAMAAREKALLDYKIREFKRQIAAGIPFAVGSDVGPFPHGTQARELELMVRYGMKPLAVLQADMIQGAKLLGWERRSANSSPATWLISSLFPAIRWRIFPRWNASASS